MPSGQPLQMNHPAEPGGFEALQHGAAQLGAGIGTQVEKAVHEARVTEATDALNQYKQTATDTVHGSTKPTPREAAEAAFNGYEPDQGYLALRGKAAGEARADTLDGLRAAAPDASRTTSRTTSRERCS
jgi:hypothetical protein